MNAVATQARVVSAALLETLAIETITEQNTAGEGRLNYFIDAAQSTDEGTFKTALSDFRKAHPKDKTFAVRASEFQTIYYGLKHGANLAEMGYNSAVIRSREFLKDKGLRGNGKPILSEEEQEANREKNLRRKASVEAIKLVDFGSENSGALLAKEVEKQMAILKGQAEQAALERKMTRINDLVKSIMDDGFDYAFQVHDSLGKALGMKPEQVQ